MNNPSFVVLILALTLAAVALMAEGREGSALECPRGFGYCDNYGKCCDLDYQCADQSQCFGGQPDNALHCPRGFGYCPGLGCCNLDFGCVQGQCFGGQPDSAIHCPRGFGYCPGLGCCDFDFGCEQGHCFGGGSLSDTIPHCPRGFGYCVNYGKCCDLDYQCANPTQCF